MKYAIFGFFGGLIGMTLLQLMGLNDGGIPFFVGTSIAITIGGAIDDWLRQRN